MANPSSEASGTQTATVTTEHTLRDVAAAGLYQLVVDLGAMVAGDVVELRCKEALLTSGTLREIIIGIFYGAQPTHAKMAISPWLSNINTDSASLRFTLKQTFGTSRDFPWQVFKAT